MKTTYLSPEEQRNLWEKMHQGDAEARAQLIESSIPWAIHIAVQFCRRKHINEYDDPIGEALVRLTELVSVWDPDKGKLSTLLSVALPRHLEKRYRRTRFIALPSNPPKDSEGLECESKTFGANRSGLEELLNEPHNSDRVEELDISEEIKQLVEATKQLPERQRKALDYHYGKGFSLAETAREMELTKPQVNYAVIAGLRALKTLLSTILCLALSLCLAVSAYAAPPTIQSVSSVASSATDTLQLNAPSGVVKGDTLLAIISCRNISQGFNWTTPTGWTLVVNALSSTTGHQTLAVFRRTAEGNANDTPAVVFGMTPSYGQQGYIYRLTGVSEITATATYESASGTGQPPILSTYTYNDCLALSAIMYVTSATGETATWPSPWTESVQQYNLDHFLTIGTQSVSAGATTADNISIPNDRRSASVSITIAGPERESYWSLRNSAATFDPLNGSTSGTVTGTTAYAGTGPYGQTMFDFDGSSRIDYGTVGVSSIWSMGLWVDQDNTTQQVFASIRDSKGLRNGNGSRNVQGWNYDGNYDITTAQSLAAGINHVLATSDGTTLRVYVNGVELRNLASGNTTATGTNVQRVGAGHSGTNFFNGKIAEYGYWPSVVHIPASVSEIHKGPEPTLTSGGSITDAGVFSVGTWNTNGNGTMDYEWVVALANGTVVTNGTSTTGTADLSSVAPATTVYFLARVRNSAGTNIGDKSSRTSSFGIAKDGWYELDSATTPSSSGIPIQILMYYRQQQSRNNE